MNYLQQKLKSGLACHISPQHIGKSFEEVYNSPVIEKTEKAGKVKSTITFMADTRVEFPKRKVHGIEWEYFLSKK